MNNKCCFLIAVALSWRFVSLTIAMITFYTEPAVAAKVMWHPMGYFVGPVALIIGRSRFLIVWFCHGLCVGFPLSAPSSRCKSASYIKYQIYFVWWINHAPVKRFVWLHFQRAYMTDLLTVPMNQWFFFQFPEYVDFILYPSLQLGKLAIANEFESWVWGWFHSSDSCYILWIRWPIHNAWHIFRASEENIPVLQPTKQQISSKYYKRHTNMYRRGTCFWPSDALLFLTDGFLWDKRNRICLE